MDYSKNEKFATTTTFSDFITKVFVSLSIGLSISMIISFVMSKFLYTLAYMLGNLFTVFIIGICIIELVIGFSFSSRISKMSVKECWVSYILYSFFTGLSLSTIVSVYTDASVFYAFMVTLIVFVSMSIIGHTTKVDISKFSSLLFAGLISIILLSVLNFFIRSSSMDYMLSVAGIIIFLGLTAYDMQKLKYYYDNFSYDEESINKVAVFGAFQLYLDFINLFIRIIQIFGRRRND